jgi:hypothetical protein
LVNKKLIFQKMDVVNIKFYRFFKCFFLIFFIYFLFLIFFIHVFWFKKGKIKLIVIQISIFTALKINKFKKILLKIYFKILNNNSIKNQKKNIIEKTIYSFILPKLTS